MTEQHDSVMHRLSPVLSASRRELIKAFPAGVAALALAVNTRSALAAARDLVVALPNNPSTLDPVMQANHDGMVVTQSIFENLVEVDVDGNLQPQLAIELPKISADNLEYVLNPENKTLRRPLFDRIAEVIVENPLRVRFRMREPYRPWLYYMTKYHGIFPKGSREKHDANYFKNGPIGLGTGPAQFVEWLQNDRVVLNRNPNYWRKGVPTWDKLVVRIIPDDSSRLAYLKTGDIDIMSAPRPADFASLKNQPGIEAASRLALGGWFFLMTNTKKPPFDDVNVRRAIACAIDRDMLASKVYYGLVTPTTIPAPPGSWWFDDNANHVNGYNVNRAKEFLARSKYASGAEFEMLV